jgi:hypothetical protein
MVVLEHTLKQLREDRVGGGASITICRRLLRTHPANGAEVTLWEFGNGAENIFQHFPAAVPLEVFVFGGGSGSADGSRPQCHAYGYYGPGDARPSINAVGPVFALVHSGHWA